MSDATQLKANKCRQRAKRSALVLFKIPDGFSSGLVEQFVDDLIECAKLESQPNYQQSHSVATCANGENVNQS